MKTITEYQPMIFSQMEEQAEKRTEQRRQLRTDVLMIGAYSVGALWLSYDTGIAVWNWQFWMIFLPFFVVGEMIERAWRTK
jgi:fatty acid desaturase